MRRDDDDPDAAGTGIIIDVCRAHGTFFDAGELPMIIDFVMAGGLDKAQRKDIERRREAAERELEQARAAPLPTARLHHDARSWAGDAFVEFLSALFD